MDRRGTELSWIPAEAAKAPAPAPPPPPPPPPPLGPLREGRGQSHQVGFPAKQLQERKQKGEPAARYTPLPAAPEAVVEQEKLAA